MTDTPSPSPSPPGRRILALALPHLSTDRIRRQKAGKSWRFAAPREAIRGKAGSTFPPAIADVPAPLAVIAKVRSALRLVALDEQAEALGLRRGQTLTDARAMILTLEAVDADEDADRALLEHIADWAERYTPLVALSPPNELLLDITGAANLFGGETALCHDLLDRLEHQGFGAFASIADTPGAAIAAVRFVGSIVVPPGGAADMLRPLPLAALRLDPETVGTMDRLGLKRIGQLIDAIRTPLANRFEPVLFRRLDQALGREEEAISPRRPVPALIAERRFAEPVSQAEEIAATLASLAKSLARHLEARGEGARAFELSLFRTDGTLARIDVGTSRPIREPQLVLDLFREKFLSLSSDIEVDFGFDTMRLAIPLTAPISAIQTDLAGDATGGADLDRLIDRIGTRLGPDRVGHLLPRQSHIPEKAVQFGRLADEPRTLNGRMRTGDVNDASSTVQHAAACDPPDRPLRLFNRPEPVEAIAEVPDGPPIHFRWRRVLYRVVRAEGPERIAGEWWKGGADDLTRDYFRVEDADGRRFWLFREGLYEREVATPRWYMHGMFA